MSQVDLAKRTGRPLKTINEIAQGKAAITPETALQLEKVLGVPASLWNNLQVRFDEAKAKKKNRLALSKYSAWTRSFPVKEMIKREWISPSNDPVDMLAQLLGFFGMASPRGWNTQVHAHVHYRKAKAHPANEEALFCWLRRAELEGRMRPCGAFKPAVFRKALEEARRLTLLPQVEIPDRLIRLCAAAGVAVVLLDELPKARVCGAVRWLSREKALLALSFRYKTMDSFWFSFFHEAGHLLLHGRKRIFVDCDRDGDRLEEEADQFARQTLIPSADYASFLEAGDFSESGILEFAGSQGLPPGVVLGRLQNENRVPWGFFHGLREPLRPDILLKAQETFLKESASAKAA